MALNLSKYQKWIPLILLGLFILSSLIYVAVVFRPTVDITVNDGEVLHIKSRGEAEVKVYKELPFKASYSLTTGEAYEMDLRYLGFSYLSEKDLERLDTISTKSFWGKFKPFFDTSQNQLIAVYPQRVFWLVPLEESIKTYPHLLKQEPQTSHLVTDDNKTLSITEPINGYQVEESDFVETTYNIGRTGTFENIPLQSTAIVAEDESYLLAQYPNLVQALEIPMPDDFTLSQNIKTAFYRMQNIYIAAGETLDISELMGSLNAESGYRTSGDDASYGVGVEQIIDTIKEMAYQNMTVLSYKGEFINIGDPGDGLTQLTVENTTGQDMVFSLAIRNNTLSVVLASK